MDFGKELATVSNKTKTVLKRFDDILGIVKYKDGIPFEMKGVIPAITNVRIYNDDDGNPCATYLDFSDGTSTYAARRHDDVYSIEHGISICITKKLLDMITDGAGNQTYNKLVRNACKVLDENNKAAEMQIEEAAAEKRKLEKIAEKKRRHDERRAAQVREELIEIQKEAFVRAMKECQACTDDLK